MMRGDTSSKLASQYSLTPTSGCISHRPRRPLAAARAVIFAQMMDDPSAHPELFPTEEAQEAERQRLFRLIEQLVQWENTTNEDVLDAARFIEINGFEDPEPEREPLEKGERYWAVMTDFSYLWLEYTWHGDEFDRLWLKRGIIHKTEEAAKIHAKALLSFTSKEEG